MIEWRFVQCVMRASASASGGEGALGRREKVREGEMEKFAFTYFTKTYTGARVHFGVYIYIYHMIHVCVHTYTFVYYRHRRTPPASVHRPFLSSNLAVIQYNIYSSRDFHNLSTFFFSALYTYYVYYNITNSVPIGARQLLYTMNNDERLPRSLCLRNVSNAEPEGRKPWGVSYV